MSAAATPPPRIPDYELIRLIGSGSYGDVWLARAITGAFRAVKIVWRDRFPDLRPFAREFEGITRFATISLREPSQLALLHAGRSEAEGYFYYVMELADDAAHGRSVDPETYQPLTLREVFAQRGRLPASEVVALGVALARALASLHAAGLVHRDVKPSNVIFVGGVPKLADVGLVAAASDEQLTFVGTEGFVPPEGPGAPGADVFSLGKLLYELATGLDRHDFPRLPAELSEWPDRREFLELNEVLLRACEGDARRRYPDATALLDELLLLQAGKSVRRLRRTERHLARTLRVAAVLAIVAAVAGTGAWVERRRANAEQALRAVAEAERDALARRSIYAATLAQAQRALEQEDFGRARQLLTDAVPAAGEMDQRGFEWHALMQEAQGDPADVVVGGGPPVARLCLTPRGDQLVVVRESGGAQLIAPGNGTMQREVTGVARLGGLSGDGEWLLGVDRDGRVHRWSIRTGQPEEAQAIGINRPLGVVEGSVLALFTDAPATGGVHHLRGWDTSAKKESWSWPVTPRTPEERADFFRAALSPDGRRVALVLIYGRGSGATWELRVIDLRTGATVHEMARCERISALAFSPDGESLALAYSVTNELVLLDLRASAPRWRRVVGRSQLSGLSFSPNGAQIAAGGRDTRLFVVRADNGETVRECRGQTAGINAIEWSGDGRAVWSAGNGGDIRRWDLAGPARPREIAGLWTPAGGGRRVCLSADGRIGAATLDGRDTLVFDTATLAPIRTVHGAGLPFAWVNNEPALLGLAGFKLALFPIRGPESSAQSGEATGSLTPVSPGISVRAGLLALADTSGRLQLWNTRTLRKSTEISAHTGGAWWAAASPDGGFVLTGGQDQMVRLWRGRDGQALAQIAVEAAVMGAIAPDSRRAALALRDGRLEVRELPSLRLLESRRLSSATLIDLVFSPAGDRLFCGGTSGAIHVLATDDWREITTLRWRTGVREETTVDRLAVSENGSTLAAYSNDGRVRMWRR